MRVAIIPARGGSRRIPMKNIRDFHGKPIIHYSIETARESGLFDRIIVSSDNAHIRAIAVEGGAETIERDEEHSHNSVGTQDVIMDALKTIQADEVCCIYATVPMLKPEDLHDGYRAMKKRVARFAMSVGTEPLRDAGMFYWGSAAAFRDGHPLISQETVMVPIPEHRICDINTFQDWELASKMYLFLRQH